MANDEVLEGEVVESRTTALATTPHAHAVEAWTPRFVAGVDEAVAQVEAKRDFYKRVMREGEHYGAIPGAGTKPTLLKPGAELLLANMGLRVELTDAEPPVRDYGDEHREGLIIYRRIARVFRQTGPAEHDRMLIAQAEGFCSSRETKYRWRESKRKCPACGAEAIIKGKPEYGGGWLCFKKQGGCGAKFMEQDAEIVGQTVGRVPNPDLADVENTLLKMADKRAVVAATLLATGCSDIFTQDAEDHAGGDSWPAGASEPAAATQNPPAGQTGQQTAKEPAKRTLEAQAKAQMEAVERAEARWNELRQGLTANERLRILTAALGNPGLQPKRKDLPKLVEVAERILAEREGIAPGTEAPDELFDYAQQKLGGTTP